MEMRSCIKTLFFLLFILTIVKLFMGESKSPGSLSLTKKIHIPNPVYFWRNNRISQINNSHELLVRKMKTKPVYENDPEAPKVLSLPPALNVVHLDLKGAAPKVSYLQQLFPLLSSLGADGILIEYEDMFPYQGDLQLLRSPFAYSVEDIEIIKKQADLNKLELIPLVQVFGHLEFVLKHEKYFPLREEADFPNSLNPLAPGSLDLVKEMLMQVLEKHPKAKWFHIGADEVFGLGRSEHSKNWLEKNGSLESLFLSHVTKVSRFIVEKRPGLKLLFWEDMLRKFSSDTIKASGMASVALPMIWNYDSKMNTSQIEKLLFNYEAAGFPGVWFASAFKGASAADQMWTPIDLHLKNHIAWIKVMAAMTQYSSIQLQGIVLTGWQRQRYEHHSVLCELLPVAIPSLATCLQTLKYGTFNDMVQNKVKKILGCRVDVNTNRCYGAERFPGSNIYRFVERIYDNLHKLVEKLMENNYLKSSFSLYHRKYNFANPRNAAYLKGPLTRMLNSWEPFLKNFEQKMNVIFYPDTVEEWMDENINPHMNKLRSLLKDIDRIMNLKGQKKSENKVTLPLGE